MKFRFIENLNGSWVKSVMAIRCCEKIGMLKVGFGRLLSNLPVLERYSMIHQSS